MLTDRYGKKHLMIDAHYSQLRDIPPSTSHFSKLRLTSDIIEKHLRSLESLGENVNNNMIVSLVKSKLPRSVIARLEEYKDDEETPWDLETIRKGLKKFVTAQEAGERQMSFNNGQPSNENSYNETPLVENQGRRRPYVSKYTTGALHAGSRPRSCVYCSENHWSDECKSYSEIESRKRRLHGRCFVCFGNHMLKNCPSKKECVYCKMRSNHHRSLCPRQFPRQKEVKGPSLKVVEGSPVEFSEQVIMHEVIITPSLLSSVGTPKVLNITFRARIRPALPLFLEFGTICLMSGQLVKRSTVMR